MAKKSEIVQIVENKVDQLKQENSIHFPAAYSPQNALKSAYLILQETVDKDNKPALEVCTPESIQNSLMDMVIQGLSPAKKQGYFLVRGNKLCFDRSYFGTMAVTKRLHNVKNVYAEIIRKDEDFKFHRENGHIVIDKHESTLESLSGEIIAAYCVIEKEDNSLPYIEIMTIEQIKNSWNKSQTYKLNGKKNKYGQEMKTVHVEFEDQMCKRTVINRACKYFANTSDDSDLLIESFNRSGETYQDNDKPDNVVADVQAEVSDVQAETEVAPPAPEPTPETESNQDPY